MPNVFHSIPLPEVAPKVAQLDLSEELGPGVVERQAGIVRIGSGATEYELEMRWRSADSRWVSKPQLVATTDDAWAVDGINQQPADFKNQWYRPVHGVAWYDTGSRAVLAADYTGGNTLTIKESLGLFANAGQLMVRGWVLNYTGKTDNGDGTFTFTGVSGGSGAVTLKANLVPVLAADGNNVGDLGGWGITTEVIEHAGQLWSAGLRLEERVVLVHLNGSQDNFAMDTALYWREYDLNDAYLDPAPWDEPAGGLGFSSILTGPATPGHPSSPSTTRIGERSFEIFKTDWVAWTPTAPTKRLLKPFLYHRMPAAAEDTGEEYGRTQQIRWVWSQ